MTRSTRRVPRVGHAHTPARRRRGPRVLGALLSGAVLLMSIGAGAVTAPAGAATPKPSPSSTSSAAAEKAGALPVRVVVTSVSPAVLRPGVDLVVNATVTNTSDAAIAAPRAVLRLARTLLSTRSTLTNWEEGRGAASATVLTVPLDAPLVAGASTTIQVTVPATALRLPTQASSWGARGIALDLVDGSAVLGRDTTFTVWLPTDQVTPVRVSVAATLTGAAETAPAGLTGPVPPSSETLTRLDAVLAATAHAPAVAWAVDPAVLAEVAASALPSGSTAPTAAAATRSAALAAAGVGRDVFALGWLDPDLAALAHGNGADLASKATALSAASPLPVLGTQARTDLAWPADAVPDVQTVSLAAREGARAVVVGGDGLAPGRLTYTPTGRATVSTPSGDVAALVADPTLTGLLLDPTQSSPATAAQRVLAETAVIARERPSELRHLFVALDRDWQPKASVARAQLDALGLAPWVELTPVPTLIGAADPEVDRSDLPIRATASGEIGSASIDQLRTALSRLTTFASITATPDTLVAGASSAILAPLSVAWRGSPGGRSAAVRTTVAALEARSAGVSIVPGSNVLVVSESGTFPVRLRNDLDQAVTVRVSLVPDKRALLVEGVPTVSIPARSEVQARVKFQARGSGEVRVEVTVLAGDGAVVAPPTAFQVRVRANWENVGTDIAVVALGLAFVFGIVRTIRRGQTTRRGASLAQLATLAEPPGDET